MNRTSNLLLSALVLSVLLASCGPVVASPSYIPQTRPDSNFCTRCRQYGCVVNRGSITQHTPCNPSDRYDPTWLFCERTASEGSCDSCRCQKLSRFQQRAVQHDLSRGVLFYALRKNELLPSLTGCNECLHLDSLQRQQEIVPDILRNEISDPSPEGSNSSSADPDSSPDASEPSSSVESPPDQSTGSCGEIGAECTANSDCCGTDVCINRRTLFLFSPRFECEACVQQGATCTSSTDCCGDLSCPRILFRVRTCL